MTDRVSNVLFIVVDALRTDRVGAYDNQSGGADHSSPLTPNIDSLAAEGERFDSCYSCINATDPLLTTLLTGMYPTTHGVLNHADDVTEEEKRFVSSTDSLPMRIDDTHTSVGIDILGRWHTRGFNQYVRPGQASRGMNLRGKVINSLSSVLNRFPEPIERPIRDLYRVGEDGNATLPATADEITNLAIDAIDTTDEPWFMLAHYWDTHIPYVSSDRHPEVVRNRSYEDGDEPLSDLLEPIRGSYWGNRLESGLLGDAETVGDVYRKYDAGTIHADRGIGRLVEKLKQEGIFDETAIFLVADHGESLTEHQILFDHHGLYKPTTHVPCIIKAPGFSGQESSFVQHFDLVPTVLDLLNKSYDEDEFDGCSLVPDEGRRLERDAVYMEEALATRKRGIRTNNYTYIESISEDEKCGYCDIAHASQRELYAHSDDSQEQENVIEDYPKVAEDLANQLENWVSARPDPQDEAVSFDPDEVMSNLEDLGYR